MKKMIFALFILSLVILVGCSQPESTQEQTTQEAEMQDESPLCTPPYFEYKKGDCCLDQNGNQICDSDEKQDEPTENEELPDTPKEQVGQANATIQVQNLLGDIKNKKFNSVIFEIKNTGEVLLDNPKISLELFYIYPNSGARNSMYTYSISLDESIATGKTKSYKIPIKNLEVPKGSVVNAEANYELVTKLTYKDGDLATNTQTIRLDTNGNIEETSFSTNFETVASTSYESKITIDSLKTSYDGDTIESITITIDNNDGLKKPIMDILIGYKYSIVFQDLGTSVGSITKEIPLSMKVTPEAQLPDYYTQLRDGNSMTVYAVYTARFDMDCEKDPITKEYKDCEIQKRIMP